MAEELFTWRATHRDLVQYLRKNRSNQANLIDVLKRAGVDKLHDRLVEDGPLVPIEVIDPFSFFCMIYKYGSKRRLKTLQSIAKDLRIAYPTDDYGIASVMPLQAFIFPYAYERQSNEIERLWDFFEAVLDGRATDAAFADVLGVRYTKHAKITEGLFNIDSEQFLPINGPVKDYLENVLGVKTAFSTWTEYQDLLARVRANVSIPFYELSYESWKWGQEQREREGNSTTANDAMNYWMFQSNPKYFDLEAALANRELSDWSVSAHKASMQPGDKVIIYKTVKNAGVYALAELASTPYPRRADDTNSWEKAEDFDWKVDLHVTHDFSTNPILKEVLASDARLKKFKGGNQGTNFVSSHDEYEAIMDLSNKQSNVHYWLFAPGEKANRWDEMYDAGEMAINWTELGDLSRYASKADVEAALSDVNPGSRRPTNNARACYEFARVLKKGDVVIAKRGTTEYVGWGVVTADYSYEPARPDYTHVRTVQWRAKGAWHEAVHPIALKTLTDITKYSDYVERLVKQLGIVLDRERVLPTLEAPRMHAMNTILFGPPGTGTTYTTVNKALDIIDPSFMSGVPTRSAIKQRYDELMNAQQICFTTFHQSLSYEDFIEGIKPTNTSDGGSLSYEVRDGVFKNFCELARSNWEASQQQRSGQLSFEAAWEKFMEEWEENPDVEIATHRTIFTVHDVRNKTIAFRKAGGSLAHTLSMNTLRDFYYDARPMTSSGLKTYYRGLLDKLQSYHGVSQSTQLRNYVFIIDEINRGNVSQIFGELITLIEDSKRLGAEEHLTAVLPYSADEFGVPPNLYILGTMNTADRSVEALDTALRRRFSFEEMQPVYDLPQLQRELHGVRVADVLSTINSRIEKLLDRDHCIGHSYFLEAALDLRHVFQNKIIPLLQEYFFGDYGKIGLVLGRGFVKVVESSNPNHVFADFDYDQALDLADRRVYRLATPQSMTGEQFAHALRSLVGA